MQHSTSQAGAAGWDTYRLPLGLAYALAPVLAGMAVAGVFQLTENEGAAVAAGGVLLGLPAAVHGYHAGPERALVSYGSMLGVTLLGAAALGGAGYLLGHGTCERGTPEYEAEGCGVKIEAMTLVGAVTGAVLGYAGHAVFDVSRNASVPAVSNTIGAPVRLWLSPVASGARDGKPVGFGGAALVGTF